MFLLWFDCAFPRFLFDIIDFFGGIYFDFYIFLFDLSIVVGVGTISRL